MPGGYALGLLSVSVCTAAACCHGIRQSTCLAGRNKFESDGQGAILPIVRNTLSAALVHNRQLTNEQCFEMLWTDLYLTDRQSFWDAHRQDRLSGIWLNSVNNSSQNICWVLTITTLQYFSISQTAMELRINYYHRYYGDRRHTGGILSTMSMS